MTTPVDLITAPDGTRLALRKWTPSADPVATVLIVHGLGEHGGRYEHVGEALAGAGMVVHAYDQRGFGLSDGPRADVGNWKTVHDDLDFAATAVRGSGRKLPIVLYGHSLGALIALGYVLSDRPKPHALVLTGPAVDDRLAGWKHLLTPLVARVAPGVRFPNGIVVEQLVRTPRPGLRYRDDPLVQWQSTVRYGALGFAEQKRVRAALARVERMPVPTLVMRGTDDPVVPARSVDRIARLGNVTAVRWQGLRHEVHNEASYMQVVDAVAEWLGRTLVTDGDTSPAVSTAEPRAPTEATLAVDPSEAGSVGA